MSLEEYWDMWQTTKVDDSFKTTEKLMVISKRINFYMPTYEEVTKITGVPAYVIACFDYRESSFDHNAYLANGDPYVNSDGKFMQTAHVPKGLGPVTNWIDGAVLSLEHEGLNLVKNWHLAHALYAIEAWNGFGYTNNGLETPYLWSKTNHYGQGLYTSDGHLNKYAIDQQIGCVPILKMLKSQGVDLQEIDPAKDKDLDK